VAYELLQTYYLKQLVEHGNPEPLHATKALLQWDLFAKAAYNSGHINAWVDPDGIHRHHMMLVKVNSGYFPTLSLAMFLDYVEVSLSDIVVNWGQELRIPAAKSNFLKEDVVIPIDERGRTFIPFPQVWGSDFDNLAAHNFLEYAQTPDLEGNLAQLFENRFVFIGDLSQGATDVGQTSLEDRVPLIAIHTALLNGLLTNSFYSTWSFGSVIALICLIIGLVTLASLPKAAWILHATGVVIIVGLIGLTWWQLLDSVLFPIATVGGSFLVIFIGLVAGLEIAISRQQAIIHHAFAKFVPETVIQELTLHPEKLTLGGEERVVSILFSDLQGFTTIAEQLPPQQLVQLLNHYLTEMTTIILNEGGTIDKYEGDAIMAEFGAPLPAENHADMAVSAALKMQRRLHELRQEWAERGFPELFCRIGINTGPVIVGNMGSDQVFDYTVIGDAANLAARLEGANKLYNTTLMISESTHHALTPHRFLTRTLDFIRVKGKSEPVMVFDVYGESGDVIEPAESTYYHNYQTGIEAYFARDFTGALHKFDLALDRRPNDIATRRLISRIADLNHDALPDNWDGSVELSSK
jgi:adenylate cyclase